MSPSQESRTLKHLFETLGPKFPKENDPFLARAVYDQVSVAATECPGVTYASTTIPAPELEGGVLDALWIVPASCADVAIPPPHPRQTQSQEQVQGQSRDQSQKPLSHAMLFLHGGGFSFGSTSGSHRRLAAHLANACRVPALSISYRLAPEHIYHAALDDCITAYKYLLEDLGLAAHNIVVAGDSCGGSLSASIPLACIRRGIQGPGAAVSLSPCYDLTHSGDTIKSNDAVDVLQSEEFIHFLADRYTGGDQTLRKEPLVSPVFAAEEDVRRLPPTWISAGGYDMLLDNATRFASMLEKAGVEVVLKVHEEQQHVMEFMAGKAPEANQSINEIGAWVRQKIGS